MGTLDVSDEGLRVAADQCAASASHLANQVPSPVIGPPAQATAAAVSGVYTAIGATVAVLAARVQANGDTLTIAATSYVSADENSGQHLSASSESVQG